MRTTTAYICAFILLAATAGAQPMAWVEVGYYPLAPSGKFVANGGWLADISVGDSLRIYGAKGYETRDFACYDVEQDRWTSVPGMPLEPDMRYPDRGGKGVADQEKGAVFAVKGNYTRAFWMYSIAGDTWLQLEDVPAGPDSVSIHSGTDMAFVAHAGSAWVYLLKGASGELYRYDTAFGWEERARAPAGAESTWASGSFIVFDQDHTIYAHKAWHHELWAYDIDADRWSDEPLTPMPYIGMMGLYRPSGAGSGGVWYDGAIYALKGGNTEEFWKYLPEDDSWQELDTIPTMGSTGRQRKVNYGGDIVALDGSFYALKGNRTCEFWRYGPVTGVAENSTIAVSRQRAVTFCRGTLLVSESQNAVLLDITGRSVVSLQPGSNDIRHLAPGVYFLRSAESGKHSAVLKVVVQK